MSISFKVWVGLAIIGLGLTGLVYTMPIVSNAVASRGLVFSEADVPPIPDNIRGFISLEIASAAIMTLGIAIAAIGHADTFARRERELSLRDLKQTKDSKSEAAGAA